MSTIQGARSHLSSSPSAQKHDALSLCAPHDAGDLPRYTNETELADESAKWRRHLTLRVPSPKARPGHVCSWHNSHTDPVCWATAEPRLYYLHARVDLTHLEVADRDGNTWVHRAAESKNAGVVIDLLDRVDNRLLNRQNKRGASPLHCAASRDARDVIVALLLRGADVTCRDQDGNTALAVACREGASSCVVDILLSHPRTDVNAVSHDGNTPLMSVIAEHHNHLIDSLMLAPGIDWRAKNRAGQNLTQIALSCYNISALALVVGFFSSPSDSDSASICSSVQAHDSDSDSEGDCITTKRRSTSPHTAS